MAHSRYLIVGGGMSAAAAVDGIREVDPDGDIVIISREPDPPYKRPPLSKALWKGDPLDSIWRHVEDKGVELHLTDEVTKIDPAGKTVTTSGGQEYSYDKLLLATGGTPRQLPLGISEDRIIYYRSANDYRKLRDWTEHGKRFAVIGGGFIGSEVAAALAMNDLDVTLIFPEAGICARMFPADLSSSLNDYYGEKGVRVLAGRKVTGGSNRDGQVALTVESDDGSSEELVVDGVVAGIGIAPNLQLAKDAGLDTNDGVVVNEQLQTSAPDVYAAGDVAEFYNPTLGTRLRVEHEDNANSMGKLAGRNMAGAGESYTHLPFFYSDLFDLGYEAVGEVDSRHQTYADWKDPYREGVVYYLEGGRVRGVLNWNTWDQVGPATELIAEPGPFSEQDLKGRLP
ncbi:MAG TPA: FAD/NAD(P)-binding oxidoreductase [Thermomicrobiaceae bacterium]|nr:FAD/NAD(P)-binding oxidoreductase [Thermomicrobiaceae bacterium]